MKTSPRPASLLLPLAALLSLATTVPAEDASPATDAAFKPAEHDLSRYSKNFEKKSPFEYDPYIPPTEPETNHFDGVSLGGYCGAGNTMSVYLIVGKEKKRITVYGDGSPFKRRDQTGFRILSLQRGTSLTTTTVLLEKSGQQKEVGFEKDTLTAKGAGAGGQGPPQVVIGPDGQPIRRPGVPRPAGAAATPVQPYKAPPPFIPGQSNNGQAGGAAAGQGNQNVQALQEQERLNAFNALKQANQPVNYPNVHLQPAINTPGQNGNGQSPGRTTRRVVLPQPGP